MSYKRLENGNVTDAPRKFEKDEYDYISDNFPMPYGCTQEVRELARECILIKLISEMNKYKLCPSMIQKFYKILFGQHLKSLAVPNTNVGGLSGESLGSTTTQSTLNTFHTAGSSKSASSGIDAIKELVYTKAERKNESSSIYFLNRYLSLREVNERKSDIIGSYVSSFIKEYKILRLPIDVNMEYFDEEQIAQIPKWTRYASRISGREIPQSSRYILRLYLNLHEMYKQRVTMKDISDALLRDITNIVLPVYGPLRDGILDIYTTDDINPSNCMKAKGLSSHYSNMNREEFEPLCLQSIYDNLESVIVKGIKGIRDASSFEVDILNTICEYRTVNEDDLPDIVPYKSKKYTKQEYLTMFEDLWIVFFNRYYKREHGIKTKHVADIFNTAKFESLLEDTNGGWLIVSGGKPTYEENKELNIKPKRLDIMTKIKRIIEKEERKCKIQLNKINKEEKEKYGKQVSYVIYPSELLRKSKLYILETEGNNLADLFRHPGIDTTLTSCNNMFQTNTILGIESTYTMFTKELSDTIRNNSSYINPVHVLLIAEYVTNIGRPLGTNFSGVYGQAGGPLELATIERAGKVISEAGEFGKYESINGISASIIVNSRLQIGTGANSVGQDIIVDGVVVDTVINEDVYTIHKTKTTVTEEMLDQTIDEYGDYIVEQKLELTNDDDDETIIPEVGLGYDFYKIETNNKPNESWNNNKFNKSQYKSLKKSNSIAFVCMKEGKCKTNYYIAEYPSLDFLVDKYEYKPPTYITPQTNVTPSNVQTEKYASDALTKEGESATNEFYQNINKYL